jgi:hypothetical protein
VKPALKCGIAAWANEAQSDFNEVRRIEKYAMRIISGAMRSTPIEELQTTTGLQPMEDIRDSRTER